MADESFEERKQRLIQQLLPQPGKGDAEKQLNKVLETTPGAGEGIHDVSPDKSGIRTALQVGVPAVATLAASQLPALWPALAKTGLKGLYATESLASLGAEGGMQASGVSEPDPRQLALAAVAPGAGRLTFTALAQLPRMLPGFGKAAQAVATPFARTAPGELLGGESAKELFSRVSPDMLKETIPSFPALAKTVKDLGTEVNTIPWDKLRNDLKQSGLETLFDDIEATLYGSPAKVVKERPTIAGKAEGRPTGLPPQAVTVPAKQPGMTLGEAQAAISGFGRIISRTGDDKLRGEYKLLYKSLLNDLENMPAPSAASEEALAQWQQARHAYKREYARNLLSEQIEKSISTKEGVDLINADRVVEWLRKNKEFKSRVSEAEYSTAIQRFRDMAKMEGHNASRFVGMLLGASVSGTPAGALAGYVASEQLSNALMSDVGRKLVGQMLKNPSNSYWRRAGAVLGAAAGGLFDQPGPLMEGQR